MSILKQLIFGSLLLLIGTFPAKGMDVQKLQQELYDAGYELTVDGILGNETRRELSKFFKDNSYEFVGIISKQTLEDISVLKKKFYRPIPWIFHDKFESIKWSRYDESHAPRNLGRIGHVKIEKENNGNAYVSLTSKVGQLSKFNRGQDRYIKDRVELGLPNKVSSFDLKNRLLWYGFKIKSPTANFYPNAHSITFTQYKQIQKNSQKKDCARLFWRMNVGNNGKIWMAVTNEIGNKINKKSIKTFINKNWSKVKVGVYFTESDRGWLRAYINDELVYSYGGRTVMNRFRSCRPKSFENRLRIGVYRGSDTKKLNGKTIEDDQSDTLHFDDFIVTDSSAKVDQVLSATN
tara:strand:- start:91 stop:1137 length:1047 start_codon:yes stop_codon:yes gene_type:complete